MSITAPARITELPPHHRPFPRVLAGFAAAAVVVASTVVGLAAPASADGENVVPAANDDAYSTPASTQLVVANPGVIGNDVDPDSTLTLYTDNTSGVAGTVFVNNEGGFTYNPTPGFAGETTFQYRVQEVGTNQLSDWATVTITVETPVVTNTAPVTVADAFVTPFDTPLMVAAGERLTLNDSDADGDPFMALSSWVPSVGSLTAYSDQGTFTFTPPAGFSGDATFTYRAFDYVAQGNSVTVTITVLPSALPNTPPVDVDNWFYVEAGQNYSLAGTVTLANATDADGDPITAQWVTAPVGDMTLSVDGSIMWSAPDDFCGFLPLQYRPFDGIGAGNLTTVELRAVSSDTGNYLPCANPVPVFNSAPVAEDDAYSVQPGGTLIVPAVSGLLGDDTDADGDTLTAIARSAPSIGSGFVVDVDGGFTWTAPADFCGAVTFTYAAADAESESNIATVTILASGEKDFVSCPDDDEEGEGAPLDEPGSPTIPTLPLPTDPGTPVDQPGKPELSATPSRDTLAYTGTSDLSQGLGWGALLAVLLGLGLVVPGLRRGASA